MININNALNFMNPLKVINEFRLTTTLNWAAVAAAVIGAVASNQETQASKGAANKQSEAAAKASTDAAFDPYNVQGAFGTGTFEDGTASVQLTPEMQALQNQFGQQAGAFAGQGQTGIGQLAQDGAMGFMQSGMEADPYALAQSQFGKMQDMLAPSRGRSQEALEGRLLKQGRLGSTGGALSQQAQQTSFNEQDQRMMLDAIQQGRADQQYQLGTGQQLGMFGQQQQDVGFNQAQARLGAMQGIDNVGLSYLNTGGTLGGRQAAAGALQGQFGMQGATAGSAALLGSAAGQSQGINKLGSAFGDYFNQNNQSSGSYDSNTGGGTLAAKTDDQWANNWDY